jgi:hypothetical protein
MAGYVHFVLGAFFFSAYREENGTSKPSYKKKSQLS